jgi:Protein of unknown function (DUF2442)
MVSNNKEIGMTESEFEYQYQEATKRGADKLKQLPKAANAQYDKNSMRMVLEMQNGITLLVPISLIQGLQSEDAKALANFELVMNGTQIHWHELDVQFYIEDLLKGIFGTPNWMKSIPEHLAEIGRKGGSQKSAVKANSSRENGRKGGRPSRKVA